MKLSELATAYDRLARAGSDPERARILAEVLRNADTASLPVIPRLTLGEIVKPELSDMLGIGPATVRSVLSELTGKSPSEISGEVRRSGDLSLIAGELPFGTDTLKVDDLWKKVNRAVERGEDRAALLSYVYGHT